MRFRTLLKTLAQSSGHPRYHHAAILAKGKVILGRGVNAAWVHAEIAALQNARLTHSEADLIGTTLYTLMVRVSTDGLGNGSPCAECMDALRWAGVRKVVVYV